MKNIIAIVLLSILNFLFSTFLYPFLIQFVAKFPELTGLLLWTIIPGTELILLIPLMVIIYPLLRKILNLNPSIKNFLLILAVTIMLFFGLKYVEYRIYSAVNETYLKKEAARYEQISAEIDQKAEIAKRTEISIIDFQDYPEYNSDGTLKSIRFQVKFSSNVSEHMNIYAQIYLFNPQLKYFDADRPFEKWIYPSNDQTIFTPEPEGETVSVKKRENTVVFTVTKIPKYIQVIQETRREAAFGVYPGFNIDVEGNKYKHSTRTMVTNINDLTKKATYNKDLEKNLFTTKPYILSLEEEKSQPTENLENKNSNTCVKENSCKNRTPGSSFRCDQNKNYSGTGTNSCECNVECEVVVK